MKYLIAIIISFFSACLCFSTDRHNYDYGIPNRQNDHYSSDDTGVNFLHGHYLKLHSDRSSKNTSKQISLPEYVNALVYFARDKRGIYYRSVDTLISLPIKFLPKKGYEIIVFDKKLKCAYVSSQTSVFKFYVKDSEAKILQKDESVIKEKKELSIRSIVASAINKLDSNFREENYRRELFLADSLEQDRQMRLLAARLKRQQEIEDSLGYQEKIEEYRLKNIPGIFTFNTSLRCSDCNLSLAYADIYVIGEVKDTIILAEYVENAVMKFAPPHIKLHTLPVKEVLHENPEYRLHREAFKDELVANDSLLMYTNKEGNIMVKELNDMFIYKSIKEGVKAVPYGFIEDYNWNNDYGMVTFNITYVNENKKTIKYIRFDFAIYNDVDDIRCNGWFQGTGPVKYDCTGTWEWDTSPYFVVGDATTMKIRKITITYMNGSKKVLTGSQIKYNE